MLNWMVKLDYSGALVTHVRLTPTAKMTGSWKLSAVGLACHRAFCFITYSTVSSVRMLQWGGHYSLVWLVLAGFLLLI